MKFVCKCGERVHDVGVKYQVLENKVWETMLDTVDAAIAAAADGTLEPQAAMMSVREVQQRNAVYQCNDCGRWLIPTRTAILYFKEDGELRD